MGNDDKDRLWVGFDLGGTKMQAMLFDGKFNVKGQRRRKTRAEEGKPAGLSRLIETINQLLDDAKVSRKDLSGIGVAVPGPLDLDRGVLLESSNLGWKNVPLRKELEEVFGCRAVVANDVDAGVYGEYRFGAARDARCVLGVFPGTGIGGGCVYEGKILRGKTGSCMEIGHIRVLPGGPLCGCGQYGCLESVASRLAVSAAAAMAALRGEAPCLLKSHGTDLSDIRSKALAESIAGGDKAVERIVRDSAGWLGAGIAAAVALLAPDIVVLGGGLVEAMPDLYLKEVEKAARGHTMQALRETFRVAVAKLGDDAATTGAAAWASESIGNREKDK